MIVGIVPPASTTNVIVGVVLVLVVTQLWAMMSPQREPKSIRWAFPKSKSLTGISL